jgi:hypothetical protein
VVKCARAEQATYDNIIQRMRFACWITKVIYKGMELVTIIAFPLRQWLQERSPILRYTYVASLVYQAM